MLKVNYSGSEKYMHRINQLSNLSSWLSQIFFSLIVNLDMASCNVSSGHIVYNIIKQNQTLMAISQNNILGTICVLLYFRT